MKFLTLKEKEEHWKSVLEALKKAAEYKPRIINEEEYFLEYWCYYLI